MIWTRLSTANPHRQCCRNKGFTYVIDSKQWPQDPSTWHRSQVLFSAHRHASDEVAQLLFLKPQTMASLLMPPHSALVISLPYPLRNVSHLCTAGGSHISSKKWACSAELRSSMLQHLLQLWVSPPTHQTAFFNHLFSKAHYSGSWNNHPQALFSIFVVLLWT